MNLVLNLLEILCNNGEVLVLSFLLKHPVFLLE